MAGRVEEGAAVGRAEAEAEGVEVLAGVEVVLAGVVPVEAGDDYGSQRFYQQAGEG